MGPFTLIGTTKILTIIVGMNNGRSNNIVSQCKRALNSGASFKDFADYTLGMGSVDSLISNVNHLRATDMWPADYVIPGDKFTLADFRKFRYALSSDVKFSVPKENVRYWGCVSGVNLNHIDGFDPSWLDRRKGILKDRSISGCVMPKDCDLSKVDLSGCTARFTDFSRAKMDPEQLLTLSSPTSIRLPLDMELSPLNGVGIAFLSKDIVSNWGWNFSSKNLENVDLSPVEGLDVGKLFARISEFRGVTFPSYKWKNPEDVPIGEPYDDISGCGFYNCDLGGIYDMPYGATKVAYFENCKPPQGIALPEPAYYGR